MKEIIVGLFLAVQVNSVVAVEKYVPPNYPTPKCNPCLGSGTRFQVNEKNNSEPKPEPRHRGDGR